MRTILGSIAALALCLAVLMSPAHTQALSPPTGHPIHSDEWYTYRADNGRSGLADSIDPLSDPAKISSLHCVWSFPPDTLCGSQPAESPASPFVASPIVFDGTVFVGGLDGYLYALDAATGAFKWTYPTKRDPFPPPLNGTCVQGGNGTFGAYGIRASASAANVGGRDVVIFGAPDPLAEGGLGSARLFAVYVDSGALAWESDVVAHVSGCNPSRLDELHERIAYSSPLVLGDKVYVGVHDAGDDPIQQGRVAVVDLSSGKLIKFPYASTGTLGDGTRGGGIWNSLATDGTGVFFTTGNTRVCDQCPRRPPLGDCFPACPPDCDALCPQHACTSGCPSSTPGCSGCLPEPNPNYGLSMIRLDKDSGNVSWRPPFQPLPFNRDDDPDWAAGATVMSASCGELIASVQKDGWSYALNASDGSMRWQFPPTGFGPSFRNAEHGNDGYRQPGAAWNDVFIVRTGGEDRITDGVRAGYRRLHALNACATTEKDRVLWIADIPDTSGRDDNAFGAPTVAGGIVFVGTGQGHLVVLGDPSIVPPAPEPTCSNPQYSAVFPPGRSFCERFGFKPVPVPTILKDIAMPDSGNIAYLRKEPALAYGAVFVSTFGGHVYKLAP